MNWNIIKYVIIASLLWALVYILYRWLLQPSRNFRLNRWWFLAGSICSIVLPAIPLPLLPGDLVTLTISPDVRALPQGAQGTALPGRSWQEALPGLVVLLYCLGAGYHLSRLLLSYLGLRKFIRKCPVSFSSGGYTVYHTTQRTAPFSFGKDIVLNPEGLEPGDINLILAHEKVHISEKHSVDIIILRLTACILWWHPLKHRLISAATDNLEFEVDNRIMQAYKADTKAYQYLLLLLAGNNHSRQELAHQFSFTHIKDRIEMMNRQPAPAALMRPAFTAAGVLLLTGLAMSLTRGAPVYIMLQDHELPAADTGPAVLSGNPAIQVSGTGTATVARQNPPAAARQHRISIATNKGHTDPPLDSLYRVTVHHSTQDIAAQAAINEPAIPVPAAIPGPDKRKYVATITRKCNTISNFAHLMVQAEVLPENSKPDLYNIIKKQEDDAVSYNAGRTRRSVQLRNHISQ